MSKKRNFEDSTESDEDIQWGYVKKKKPSFTTFLNASKIKSQVEHQNSTKDVTSNSKLDSNVPDFTKTVTGTSKFPKNRKTEVITFTETNSVSNNSNTNKRRLKINRNKTKYANHNVNNMRLSNEFETSLCKGENEVPHICELLNEKVKNQPPYSSECSINKRMADLELPPQITSNIVNYNDPWSSKLNKKNRVLHSNSKPSTFTENKSCGKRKKLKNTNGLDLINTSQTFDVVKNYTTSVSKSPLNSDTKSIIDTIDLTDSCDPATMVHTELDGIQSHNLNTQFLLDAATLRVTSTVTTPLSSALLLPTSSSVTLPLKYNTLPSTSSIPSTSLTLPSLLHSTSSTVPATFTKVSNNESTNEKYALPYYIPYSHIAKKSNEHLLNVPNNDVFNSDVFSVTSTFKKDSIIVPANENGSQSDFITLGSMDSSSYKPVAENEISREANIITTPTQSFADELMWSTVFPTLEEVPIIVSANENGSLPPKCITFGSIDDNFSYEPVTENEADIPYTTLSTPPNTYEDEPMLSMLPSTFGEMTTKSHFKSFGSTDDSSYKPVDGSEIIYEDNVLSGATNPQYLNNPSHTFPTVLPPSSALAKTLPGESICHITSSRPPSYGQIGLILSPNEKDSFTISVPSINYLVNGSEAKIIEANVLGDAITLSSEDENDSQSCFNTIKNEKESPLFTSTSTLIKPIVFLPDDDSDLLFKVLNTMENSSYEPATKKRKGHKVNTLSKILSVPPKTIAEESKFSTLSSTSEDPIVILSDGENDSQSLIKTFESMDDSSCEPNTKQIKGHKTNILSKTSTFSSPASTFSTSTIPDDSNEKSQDIKFCYMNLFESKGNIHNVMDFENETIYQDKNLSETLDPIHTPLSSCSSAQTCPPMLPSTKLEEVPICTSFNANDLLLYSSKTTLVDDSRNEPIKSEIFSEENILFEKSKHNKSTKINITTTLPITAISSSLISSTKSLTTTSVKPPSTYELSSMYTEKPSVKDSNLDLSTFKFKDYSCYKSFENEIINEDVTVSKAISRQCNKSMNVKRTTCSYTSVTIPKTSITQPSTKSTTTLVSTSFTQPSPFVQPTKYSRRSIILSVSEKGETLYSIPCKLMNVSSSEPTAESEIIDEDVTLSENISRQCYTSMNINLNAHTSASSPVISNTNSPSIASIILPSKTYTALSSLPLTQQYTKCVINPRPNPAIFKGVDSTSEQYEQKVNSSFKAIFERDVIIDKDVMVSAAICSQSNEPINNSIATRAVKNTTVKMKSSVQTSSSPQPNVSFPNVNLPKINKENQKERIDREIFHVSKRLDIPINNVKIKVNDALTTFKNVKNFPYDISSLTVLPVVLDPESGNTATRSPQVYKLDSRDLTEAYKQDKIEDVMAEVTKVMPTWSLCVDFLDGTTKVVCMAVNSDSFPFVDKTIILDSELNATVYIRRSLKKEFCKQLRDVSDVINLILEIDHL